MQIRWRLTLWFGLILFVILVLSSSILYVILQRNLYAQVDNSLRVNSARIHGTLDPNEIPSPLDYEVIHSKLPPINEFTSPGIYIQILNQDGNVVVKSDNLGDQELPVDLSLVSQGFSGISMIQTVAAGNDSGIRIMVSPMYINDQVLLLEVGQSMQFVDTAMRHVRVALAVSIFLALVLSVVLGSDVVRRALNPVSRISETARSIASGIDLSQRVGHHRPADEIGKLAATIDDMLEQIQRAFVSQKNFIEYTSHELRNPLTVIRGNLDLLKLKLKAMERKESLDVIDAEARRMAAIVNDMLFLAELESSHQTKSEDVVLNRILDEEVRRAGAIAGKRKIDVLRSEAIVIKGEPEKLKQLMSNLIGNAIKYSSEKSRVTLSLYRDNHWAYFEVADNGIGIPEEDLPHIFDRFYRVDKARSRDSGGTGLGLAIVKGIAEQHGGDVSVSSEPNVGSKFTVRLKL